MGIQKLKETNVRNILAAVAILIVIISMISFQQQIPEAAGPESHIYDKKFIAALTDLSTLVPDDSVLVVSAYRPIVTYFTGHIAEIPRPASTQESLVKYMEKNGYNYLVVFEGRSSEEELTPLFSSKGSKSLDDNFQLLDSFSSDFSTIYLYKLKDLLGINGEKGLIDNVWQSYTIAQSHILDFGRPDLSAVSSIKIRVADDGTGPVSAWLGSLSLVDEDGNETVITNFQSEHGFKKMRGPGTQADDTIDFTIGTQSLKLETDGSGSAVVSRYLAISPSIDFTGKQLKLWVKISDISKLSEFRITVTSDDFTNYRNYWIQMPSKV